MSFPNNLDILNLPNALNIQNPPLSCRVTRAVVLFRDLGGGG